MYGDFPAKNTRSTMYIPMNGWFWPTLNICIHCVACTHRSASLRQLRNTHTHTHTHTQTHTHGAIDMVWCCFLHTSYTHHTHTQSNRQGVVLFFTHIIHTSYTHTHTQSNRQGVVLFLTHIIHTSYTHHTHTIHTSHTTYACIALHVRTGQPA
jgi:hypothetical protein